jgi:CHAP domain
MKGAHYRVRNMSRPSFATFVFGLCLFGLGIGIMSAGADPGPVSVALTPTTTSVSTTIVVEPPAPSIRPSTMEKSRPAAKKIERTEIGTALSIVREQETTTTTITHRTPLQVAQAEVGKTGPYAEGGFWCAKFTSWVAEQADVERFISHDGPSALYADAVTDGRFTDKPAVGYMVFIDLFGPEGIGHGQVTHVGIVESIDGDAVNIIQGNGDPDPSVVTRTTYHLGDGYLVGFAPFAA